MLVTFWVFLTITISDSPLSVFREAGIFFPSFDICTWYEKEEKYFRNGYVKYCEDIGIHCIEGKDAPCEISESSRWKYKLNKRRQVTDYEMTFL